MSVLSRARKFNDSLVTLRKRLNRSFRLLHKAIGDSSEVPPFDDLFRLCSECSFSACMFFRLFLSTFADNFPGGFLFYVWLNQQGESWIQKLLASAEKVIEKLNVNLF